MLSGNDSITMVLTSGDNSDAHQDRGISNMHLSSHYTARRESRYRYLTRVCSEFCYNFSNSSTK